MRVAAPLVPAAAALGASFGVLARTAHVGAAAAVLGAGVALWVAWTGGTAVGALLGGAIGNPSSFGLDGAFAAFFLALVGSQLRSRRAFAAAAGGALIAVALTP
jgi:predicted branched-subunit amino acid permease